MATHPGLVTEERRTGSQGLLKLAGEIDVETSPAFRERVADLYQDGVRTLVLDLFDVTFTDSSAIGSFVVAHKLFSAGGVTFMEALAPVPLDHVPDKNLDLVLGRDGGSRHVAA